MMALKNPVMEVGVAVTVTTASSPMLLPVRVSSIDDRRRPGNVHAVAGLGDDGCRGPKVGGRQPCTFPGAVAYVDVLENSQPNSTMPSSSVTNSGAKMANSTSVAPRSVLNARIDAPISPTSRRSLDLYARYNEMSAIGLLERASIPRMAGLGCWPGSRVAGTGQTSGGSLPVRGRSSLRRSGGLAGSIRYPRLWTTT